MTSRAPFARDDEAAGGRTLLMVALGILLLAAVAGLAFYLMDGSIEATVRSKECLPGFGSRVDVETEWLGIDHTVEDVPLEACTAVAPGNHVVYHVRSERTILYANDGGRCVYDSERGLGC